MAKTITACVDGAITDPANAVIPATDDGLLRGDGVFEVIRVYAGRPFGLEAHLDRLEASAAAIALEVDRPALESDVALALDESEGFDAALRIVSTRGGHRLILIEELPERAPTASMASVTYEPNPILEGVKSLSYAANMHATRIARSRGADEALFVRADGTVLEAPTAAIFWSDGDGLCTPALANGILASITRAAIVDALEVSESSFTLEALKGAREAFLASTTREVHPVSAIDGAELPTVNGELTQSAASALRAAIDADLSRG